jgi:hypothetical protein
MTDSRTAATEALDAARRLQARVHRSADACTIAWKVLAALLIAGALDMLWPLPALLRAGWALGAGCWALAKALLLLSVRPSPSGLLSRVHSQARRRSQGPTGAPPPVALAVGPGGEGRTEPGVSDAALARAIERLRPELDNALIHAVQFGPAVALPPDQPGAIFLRRERERAARLAAQLPLHAVVDRSTLRDARRILLAVILFLLLTIALFPRVWRFELPRFFAFWTDLPPFTLTDFAVTPRGVRLFSGDGLAVTVRVGGLMPQRLELITGQAGEPDQTLPLTAVDAGVFEARLEGLTRDTWYCVAADTGRSARYLAQVVPRLPARTAANRAASGSHPGQRPGQAEQASAPRPTLRRLRAGSRTGGGVGEKGKANTAAQRLSAERASGLRGKAGEIAPDVSSAPPKATDREAARYPAEYRRLVQDYFRTVASGK